MSFEPTLLRALLTVANTGSFTRAGQILNSTQTTVSAQIQRLEQQVGKPLFERSTRRVTLSPAGETLVGFARTILQLHEDARASLADGGFSGKLKIGVAEDLVDEWLPRILRHYAEQHPAVSLDLEIGIVTTMYDKLLNKELDIVVGSHCGSQAAVWPLWQEPLVWVFAEGCEPLDPLPLAFFPNPCPYREEALRALAKSSCSWQFAGSSPSMAGMRAIVKAGLAATPLPRGLVGPGLRILGPDTGLPALPDVKYMIYFDNDDSREAVVSLAVLIQNAASRF
jgi:DNA-binding transcriptional LysR family regulator